MAILQLVDQLTEMLNQGKEVPLSRYRMVDTDEFTQMLDRMRISVPSSVRDSERTLAERDRILAEAKAEAESIVSEAKARAAAMLQDNEVIAVANREADQILQDGRKQAQEQMKEADNYAIQVLQDLAGRLQSVTKQVENGINVLKSED